MYLHIFSDSEWDFFPTNGIINFTLMCQENSLTAESKWTTLKPSWISRKMQCHKAEYDQKWCIAADKTKKYIKKLNIDSSEIKHTCYCSSNIDSTLTFDTLN